MATLRRKFTVEACKVKHDSADLLLDESAESQSKSRRMLQEMRITDSSWLEDKMMVAETESVGPADDELLSEQCDGEPTENWRERQRKTYEATAVETQKLNMLLD